MNPLLAGNPYAQYQQAQVDTASPERLLLMLYEGAIRFLNAGRKGILERKYEMAHQNIVKAQDIITEFMATLNMKDGGEFAQNLFDLYEYLNNRLTLANTQKDAAIVEEVLGFVKELHEAWGVAAKNVAAERKASA
jgi:flagellar protein FliS